MFRKVFEKVCDAGQMFLSGKKTPLTMALFYLFNSVHCKNQRDESVYLDSILITVTPLIFSEPLSIIKVKIQISKTQKLGLLESKIIPRQIQYENKSKFTYFSLSSVCEVHPPQSLRRSYFYLLLAQVCQ